MARSTSSDNTQARARLARENAAQVLKENALQGERLVAWVRLALVGLIVVSQTLAARGMGEGRPPDRGRMLVALLYTAWAVGTLWGLHRVRERQWNAAWTPVFMSLLDYGYYLFMGWNVFTTARIFEPQRSAVIYSILLCFSVSRYHVRHVVLSTLLACASYNTLTVATGTASWSANGFVCGVFVALGLLIALTRRRTEGMFMKLRQLDTLSRFLPPRVARRLEEQGLAALAPVQREVTILFSDLRDFTTLSEQLSPRQVLEMLDEYFGHMSHIIKEHNGMVNKFLGDGLLACWGAPEASSTHAEDALRAALDMRAKLAELNAWREQQGQPPLRIGIGVHTGPVAAGLLGGAELSEYTLLGDTVNLASRVEGLTKGLGVDILVSEATWRQASGRFAGERLSEQRVKGRQEAVVVYSLHGTAPSPAAHVPASTGT